MDAPPHFRTQFYGRRRGRPLRAGQAERKTGLLPQVAFTLPDDGELEPSALFAPPPREVWLEIGFGGGEHLAEQAERHPDIGFIGCEVFENGIVKLLGEIERRGLGNIRVYADDARGLLAALRPGSIGRVFVLFPDPWPKARHHKRRLIMPTTLDRLAEIMADRAELRLATDDPSYLGWVLEHRHGTSGLCLDRAPARRLARPAARLARDALRGQGAQGRPHPGLPTPRTAVAKVMQIRAFPLPAAGVFPI